MNPAIKAWLAQPSTILGISGIVGTAAAAIAHVLTHDMTATLAAGTIAASMVHVGMPDNSNAPKAIQQLVTDAATAMLQNKLAAMLPVLLSDGMAVVTALQAPATAVTVQQPGPDTTVAVAVAPAAPVVAPTPVV